MPERAISTVAMRKIFQREGLQPPKMLTLALTGACNLSCSHCWVDSGPDGLRPQMPEASSHQLLREFATLGGTGVRFTGGEPLCHPAWLGCLQFSRELGFAQLLLQTNATLLSEELAAQLAELDFPGLGIQVSLEGACAASHDRIRGEGAFAAALAGIERLIAAGLGSRINLAFTELRHNLAQFPQLLELAETLGIAAVTAGTLVTGGRAAEEQAGAAAPPSIGQYLELIDRFETDLPFRERYHQRGNLTALEWWQGQPPDSGCCQFVEQPYITPAGKLYPCLMCHSDAFAVSGLFDRPLTDSLVAGAELWSSLQASCRLRPTSIARCRSCPEQGVCAAGCPGRALGSSGSLQAPDDRCALRQAIARKRRGGINS